MSDDPPPDCDGDHPEQIWLAGGVDDDPGDYQEKRPVRCEHLELVEDCPTCGPGVLLPGEPGQVRVSRAEADDGTPVFEYLTTHPTLAEPYLSVAGLPNIPGAAAPRRRAQGLCGLTLLDLQDRIAAASRRNAPDYAATGHLTLFALLANVANQANHSPGRTFSCFTNQPRWFGLHVTIVGPRRRGKGIALSFVEEGYSRALPGNGRIVRAQRLSLPGIFGGTVSGKHVDGAVEQAAHGIVLFPELANLRGLLAGPGGTDAAGTVAEFLSSGEYNQSLLKGHHSLRSFAHFVGAVQPSMWDSVAESVIGIGGRFVFAWLDTPTPSETVERLALLEEGHPFDPLAVEVFGAKVRYTFDRLAPATLDIGQVTRRLTSLVERPLPATLFDETDLSRHVALALGEYLATLRWSGVDLDRHPGLTGKVVLPDPFATGHEVLRGVVEADAQTRLYFDRDAADRLALAIDSMLGRGGYMGTRTERISRTQSDIVAWLAHVLRVGGETVRQTIVGYRSRSGALHPSFIERRILRDASSDEFDELLKAEKAGINRRRAAGELSGPEALTEGVGAFRRAVKRRPGRPAKVFTYIWPEDRVHTSDGP